MDQVAYLQSIVCQLLEIKRVKVHIDIIIKRLMHHIRISTTTIRISVMFQQLKTNNLYIKRRLKSSLKQ